jgi:hypothetical protein
MFYRPPKLDVWMNELIIEGFTVILKNLFPIF